jgi:copper chaperone CopZ
MKSIFYVLLLGGFLFSCKNAPEGSVATTFKVWGNCGMCKKTIEKSLMQDGIYEADWNKESKLIEVIYDPKKISLEKINSFITGVGYDTGAQKGSDSAYATLHECCKYERK